MNALIRTTAFVAACTLTWQATPQESAPPANAESAISDAAIRGFLVSDPQFGNWSGNALVDWVWKAGAGAALARRDVGLPGVQIVVAPESEARLVQFIQQPKLLPGDRIRITAVLHCAAVDEVQLAARVYGEGDKVLGRADVRPNVVGESTLQALITAPAEGVAHMSVGLFFPPRPGAGPATVTVSEIRAEVVPAIP